MVWTIAFGIVLGVLLLVILPYVVGVLVLIWDIIESIVTDKRFWILVVCFIIFIGIVAVLVSRKSKQYNSTKPQPATNVSSIPTQQANLVSNNEECQKRVNQIKGQWFYNTPPQTYFNRTTNQCYAYILSGEEFQVVNAGLNKGGVECHRNTSEEMVCSNNLYNYSELRYYTSSEAISIRRATIQR